MTSIIGDRDHAFYAVSIEILYKLRATHYLFVFMRDVSPGGVLSFFCGYIGEAPASTSKPKKLLKFADHPKKYQFYQAYPKKILELLAYPKKLHVFIFFMPIDEILSHPYDLSCWWDVKSQINQPTEHITIQLVYVGTRK